MKRTKLNDSQVRLAISQWFKESEGREFRSTLYSKLRKSGLTNPSIKAREIIAGLHLMDIVNIQKRGKIVRKTVSPQINMDCLNKIIAVHKKDKDDIWTDLMSRQSCKDGRKNNSRPTSRFHIIADGKSIHCDVFEYADGVLKYQGSNQSIKMTKCKTIKIMNND